MQLHKLKSRRPLHPPSSQLTQIALRGLWHKVARALAQSCAAFGTEADNIASNHLTQDDALIEMRLKRETFDIHFGSASERFMEACRTISNDIDSPRLASLIRFLLEKTAIASELLPPATPTGASATSE